MAGRKAPAGPKLRLYQGGLNVRGVRILATDDGRTVLEGKRRRTMTAGGDGERNMPWPMHLEQAGDALVLRVVCPTDTAISWRVEVGA
jgi:hypothetical protein